MDWLTFAAEVIKALAWPLTVLIIFLVLRKPLSNLLPLLQRLRYKELEIDFGKRIQELAVEVKKELPDTPEAESRALQRKEQLEDLAQVSPRAAILEAWLELEQVAVEATKRHGLNLTSRERKTPILLERALQENEVLDESKRTIFGRLRNLRNAAVHASDFSFDPDSAIEYADSALRLAEYLRGT